jgi:hypothetical protein
VLEPEDDIDVVLAQLDRKEHPEASERMGESPDPITHFMILTAPVNTSAGCVSALSIATAAGAPREAVGCFRNDTRMSNTACSDVLTCDGGHLAVDPGLGENSIANSLLPFPLASYGNC